jgi:hypothetical protein
MLVGVITAIADLAVDTYFVVGVMWMDPDFAGLRDDNAGLAEFVYALVAIRVLAYGAIAWLVLWLRRRLGRVHNGDAGVAAALMGSLGVSNLGSVGVTFLEVYLSFAVSLNPDHGDFDTGGGVLWTSLGGDAALLVIAVAAMTALLLPSARRYCAAPRRGRAVPLAHEVGQIDSTHSG